MFPIEPFGPLHDRQSFCSGNEALDRYFRERVRKEIEAGVAAAFVMANGSSVAGYYTLSAHGIDRGTIPEAIVKKLKLPPYSLIPATLMGRLAVDRSFQGMRVGETLLMDALERSYLHSRNVASFAVTVDAKDDAVGFYVRYGFQRLAGSNRMFIPMATVKSLVDVRSSAGGT